MVLKFLRTGILLFTLKVGWLIVPQKHCKARKFIYNSGFFITTNEYPDFGEGRDGEVIKRRLKIKIFQKEK